MIVRHQRESVANRGFRHLARYIHGRDTKPRATWFHAANLPEVGGKHDLELACKLVDAVQAQNTRAGSKRTYHLVISLHSDDRQLERKELQQIVERLVDTLGFSEHQYLAVRHNDTDHEHIHVAINKIHPETFRIHSPAWDHQKLFTGARALERELGLTPLRSRTRDRENVPQRAADCEAHHGIDSFARWAREKLRPALQATELRSWNAESRTARGQRRADHDAQAGRRRLRRRQRRDRPDFGIGLPPHRGPTRPATTYSDRGTRVLRRRVGRGAALGALLDRADFFPGRSRPLPRLKSPPATKPQNTAKTTLRTECSRWCSQVLEAALVAVPSLPSRIAKDESGADQQDADRGPGGEHEEQG